MHGGNNCAAGVGACNCMAAIAAARPGLRRRECCGVVLNRQWTRTFLEALE